MRNFGVRREIHVRFCIKGEMCSFKGHEMCIKSIQYDFVADLNESSFKLDKSESVMCGGGKAIIGDVVYFQIPPTAEQNLDLFIRTTFGKSEKLFTRKLSHAMRTGFIQHTPDEEFSGKHLC